MQISAQLSLYPLGQADLSPAIDAVWQALHAYGLSVEPGTMSTMIRGEDGLVFAGLRESFAQAAQFGGTVMVVTLSNACPARPRDESE